MVMSQKERIYTILLVGFFVLLFFGLGNGVLAAHIVRTFAGQGITNISFNEDVNNIYNISVNNTDLIQAQNITQVNITIPSNFTFITNTNLTHGSSNNNISFSNTSTVLSWTNLSLFVVNATSIPVFFTFNATVANPSNYTLIIRTLNATGLFESNISVQINDTTVPSSVEFTGQTENNSANVSRSNINVNVTATDNGRFANITINLFNATKVQINSSFNATTSFMATFSGLSDGVYQFNVSARDEFSNINYSVTRNVTLDVTMPSVTYNCTPSSVLIGQTVTCACTATDATSGVVSTSFTTNPSTNSPGVFTPACSVTDYAGNLAEPRVTYTVNGTAGSGGSGGGGSSGGSGTSQPPATTVNWQTTISQADQDLGTKKSVSQQLSALSRVQLKVDGETHYVGVVSISGSSAVIEVASVPLQKRLSIGESSKFDSNEDGFYDMKVTLVSIEGARANVTIEYLHEAVAPAQAGSTREPPAQTGTGAEIPNKFNISKTLWIGIIVIVIVLIFLVLRIRRKK